MAKQHWTCDYVADISAPPALCTICERPTTGIQHKHNRLPICDDCFQSMTPITEPWWIRLARWLVS